MLAGAMGSTHTSGDAKFSHYLRNLPKVWRCRYAENAEQDLVAMLFLSLAGSNDDYLRYFFPQGVPAEKDSVWKLSKAQGASYGAEYTQAARGKRCGHVFRNGEATYCCRTCTADDTCVLCARCFEASEHEGHQVQVSMSLGATGCCDCGDSEAFVRPIDCSIHTAHPGETHNLGFDMSKTSELPEALQESIRSTIRRALDYLCDVFSCSPEHMRLPKTEESIRKNEHMARLRSKWYGGTDQLERTDEFALVLWNDEKHTMDEVTEQVAKACRKTRTFGTAKAHEIDAIGRSVIEYSTDLTDLLNKARVIEQLKVAVTIRSSRDTFREQMCGTIIEWLSDIAGCSVGDDHHFLMNTICEEMLLPWRIGSEAFNMQVGQNGIPDQLKTDNRLARINLQRRIRVVREAAQLARADTLATALMTAEEGFPETGAAAEDEDDEDEDEDDVDEENEFDEMDLDGMVIVENVEDTAEVGEALNQPEELDLERAEQALAMQPPDRSSDDSNEEDGPLISQRDPRRVLADIPKTPKAKSRPRRTVTPGYWYDDRPDWGQDVQASTLPVHEDLDKRVRIDFLILYDLRMWKKLRNTLRHLYITTVITVPSFKRILGLRFAALYTWLAQLYLIADREPDHSIINLSLQMLTTPSITAEIVERGKFFTRLLAILYTFLTKRQVGHPDEVDPTAMMALDAGVITNRRIHHFFQDMRYLLDSPYVQQKIREEDEYLLQFIDYVKLYQGICPNVRAVGEHIEYESDAWLSAGMVARDVTHVSRQFCDSFKWKRSQDAASICRAIRQTAKATIINSLGVERERFAQAEMKAQTFFKPLERLRLGFAGDTNIVDCTVEESHMSFHHALHYTLSWLIDAGKSMSREQLQGLLSFTHVQLLKPDSRSSITLRIPAYNSQEYLLAMFDIPLRVCVWLSQMRTGLWVRNGMTLRHQMSSYRSVGQRDLAYQRDIFLLQVACVVCAPEVILASMVDRFGLTNWILDKKFEQKEGFEESQWVDIAEDFIHLLVTILSDRTAFIPVEEEPYPEILAAKKDITHALCFRPMSHSELTARLSDKVQELTKFSDVLNELAIYRPPEGLSDVGMFELREEYYEHIDPYQAYYSKNQREEAEAIYRTRTSKRTGQGPDEIVYEPQLRPIRSGLFSGIGALTGTPLFAQIIFGALGYAFQVGVSDRKQPTTSRIESFLQMILHLALVGLAEDKSDATKAARDECSGFSWYALRSASGSEEGMNILWYLIFLQKQGNYPGCNAKLRLVLARLRERRRQAFYTKMAWLGFSGDKLDYTVVGPASVQDPSDKKKQALERQARVMASFKKQQNEFIENQGAQTIDWGVDDDSDMEDSNLATDEPPHAKNVFTFPAGTCIFCQEETDDQRLYGTLALMCRTNLMLKTPLVDEAYVEDALLTPCNLDRPAKEHQEASSETNNIGSPSQHNPGSVVTGCGHLMHWSCFKTYDLATQRRQGYQVARQHPERLKLQEFVCPLCKALGNAFLPIIWKPIEQVDPRSTQTTPFDVWLEACSRAPLQALPAEDRSRWITKQCLQAPILRGLVPSTFRQSTLASDFINNFWQPGFVPGQRFNQQSHLELRAAYIRLQTAIVSNDLAGYTFETPASGLRRDSPHLTLGNAGYFARALGCSIAATEIAQRGRGAHDTALTTGTYLDNIPPQALTHLHILSETTNCYIIGVQTEEMTLIAASHRMNIMQPHQNRPDEPFLSQDPFIVLTECSVFLDPLFTGNFQHILRLCCYAEIIRVVIAFAIGSPHIAAHAAEVLEPGHIKMQCSAREAECFSGFVQGIIDNLQQGMDGRKLGSLPNPDLSNPNYRTQFDRLVRAAALTYVLPFVRKALLLLHVHHHWDLANVTNSSDGLTGLPELTRITNILGLPAFDGMVLELCTNPTLHNLTRGWCHHWREHNVGLDLPEMSLAHPAIYQLIPLPRAHDSLNSAAMLHRCPSTGRELNDPCVCLFCGEIFCGQAQCCSVGVIGETLGGCYLHQRKCAGNIGMFLNIRKCAVLFLNGRHGSWQAAPYLDRHGEVDIGLRRRNQLFLSKKRYDKLFTEVWLNHGVPSAISRKLEQDVNTGGWESL